MMSVREAVTFLFWFSLFLGLLLLASEFGASKMGG